MEQQDFIIGVAYFFFLVAVPILFAYSHFAHAIEKHQQSGSVITIFDLLMALLGAVFLWFITTVVAITLGKIWNLYYPDKNIFDLTQQAIKLVVEKFMG